MTKPTLTKLAALCLSTVVMSACDPGEDPDLDTPRGALLYDLSEAQLEEIHAAYLAEEDIELTRARLTAPFDCSLYDQFCEQVGPEAAYEITGEMVDLALEGASPEDIEAHLDARIDEAATLVEAAEAQGEEGFRAGDGWVIQTKGNFRLRAHHGVTTPLIGKRRAWTEAQVQKQTLGIWSNKEATHLCVNAGPNYQLYKFWTQSTGWEEEVIEYFNPSNSCDDSIKTKTVTTFHERHSGSVEENTSWGYYIYANGCATAEINALNFKVCPPEYYKYF
jgi:hypothetical protein